MNRARLAQTSYICAITAVFGVVAGCNRSAPPATTAGGSKSPPTGAAASTAPPPKSIDLERPIVRIETTAGVITAQLDGARAPGTVRNFINCAREGFYDDTLVHYVAPDQMLVAGGYSADRKPKPARPPIRNEAHNGLKNTRGTIAMARDAALIDSATTQFFINLADSPKSDHTGDSPTEYGYCVFGQITEGLDVAEKISKSPTTNGGGDLAQTPDPPVVIKSIDVVK